MVDSKTSAQSKFYASDDKTILRFSVGALVFKDMVSASTDKKVNMSNGMDQVAWELFRP